MTLKFLMCSYRLNEKAWTFFIKTLYLCLFLYLFPYLIKTFYGEIKFYGWLKILVGLLRILYELCKEFITALSTGILFYLMFNTWQEIPRIKNELCYVLVKYKQMKREVLKQMILAEYKGLMPSECESLIEELYLNPRAAQNYFNHDRFLRMLENLDKEYKQSILQNVQSFLSVLYNIKCDFLKGGNPSLTEVYEILEDIVFRLDKMLEDERVFLDWSNESQLKSTHPLYRLFCLEHGGEDILYQVICRELKKYEI